MNRTFEVETCNASNEKWALYAVEGTVANAKRRVAGLLRAGVPECNVRVQSVVREDVNFLLGSADDVISEYFNFCTRHGSCGTCEYCDEESSVACLKRFITEWEKQGKEKLT